MINKKHLNLQTIGIHLGLLVIYQTIIYIVFNGNSDDDGHYQLERALMSSFLVGIHGFSLLATGIYLLVKKKTDKAKVYLLATSIIGTIGFSSCSLFLRNMI